MKKLLIFSLIGFTLLGCGSDNDEVLNDSDYAEYIIQNSIDSEINFMVEETYTTNEIQEPVLGLKLITSEIFPCINYRLSTTQFINGNELIIRFEQIIEPEICFTAMGSATSYIELPENTNKITFLNGTVIDKYSIDINEQKISLTDIENNFTTSSYDKTFRIPKNSFAYVCGTNTNNTNIYTDFSSIIEQNPNFIEFEFEGEGRIPYPETTDGNWVNHPSKYYKYSNSEEFNNLANLLNDYSSENIEENSGVTISIYSWNNIKFYSWIEN
ncbi:hypothetical protein QVZ41_07260 [Wenyingzhuangia sp. chi5]|uniref:Lipoprotein n=1 Tax=Wenyingzhuangia gilva TaxID=3057677 RepID=A0ABT8VRP9_9FLAO|nr:hypothetical protein [Wenyingzhuangia sp. chi5]MDO3694642.1 hypothetical protein [Wenyingzhuangia sp. chi5]